MTSINNNASLAAELALQAQKDAASDQAKADAAKDNKVQSPEDAEKAAAAEAARAAQQAQQAQRSADVVSVKETSESKGLDGVGGSRPGDGAQPLQLDANVNINDISNSNQAANMLNDISAMFDRASQAIDMEAAKLIRDCRNQIDQLESAIKDMERQIENLKALAKKIELVARKIDEILPKIVGMVGTERNDLQEMFGCPNQYTDREKALTDMLAKELKAVGVEMSGEELRPLIEAMTKGGQGAMAVAMFIAFSIAELSADQAMNPNKGQKDPLDQELAPEQGKDPNAATGPKPFPEPPAFGSLKPEELQGGLTGDSQTVAPPAEAKPGETKPADPTATGPAPAPTGGAPKSVPLAAQGDVDKARANDTKAVQNSGPTGPGATVNPAAATGASGATSGAATAAGVAGPGAAAATTEPRLGGLDGMSAEGLKQKLLELGEFAADYAYSNRYQSQFVVDQGTGNWYVANRFEEAQAALINAIFPGMGTGPTDFKVSKDFASKKKDGVDIEGFSVSGQDLKMASNMSGPMAAKFIGAIINKQLNEKLKVIDDAIKKLQEDIKAAQGQITQIEQEIENIKKTAAEAKAKLAETKEKVMTQVKEIVRKIQEQEMEMQKKMLEAVNDAVAGMFDATRQIIEDDAANSAPLKAGQLGR